MKRSVSILLVNIIVLIHINAQDPEITHYMYNYMAINPGFAGSEEELYLTVINRKDFITFGNSPMMYAFNVNTPFKFLNNYHGVGLSFEMQRYPFNNDFNLDLSYAYKLYTESGKFSFGINIGLFNNNYSNPQWLDPSGGTGDSDPLIPKGSGSIEPNKTSFDIGAGFLYKNDNLYMGISGQHLNSPKMSNSENIANNNNNGKLSPSFYIFSGYNISLSNPLFVAKPSVLMHIHGSMMALNLTGLVEYNKRLWGGVSYRTGSAFSALLGIELINGLRMALAYDIGTNKLMSYGKGSYEIIVNYRVNLKVDRKVQRYKSIRFL